ncbi:MAG: flagellar hook-associated protein 3 [Spirochaetota bacterium]|nr:flagellar hook-associated protein 3 [Spirochaetota bacterium]
MFRVTTGMLKDTMLYNLGAAHREMNIAQTQIETGKKAEFPHQDPTGIINSMLYKSRITELKEFQRNIDDGESRLRFYDTALESAGSIMTRMKELAVQLAHGTYNANDREITALEVDALLHQLIEIANTRYRNETIFSGFKVSEDPFRGIYEKVPNAPYALINKVEYHGDIGIQKREIEQQQYVGINIPGNRVFWGDDMYVSSTIPGTDYNAVRDQVFRVNGIEIDVRAGDTLPVIVQKINAANMPVHASIDNTRGTNLLVLETTDPHQLWVEDLQGGSVMQDLGIIGRGSFLPPNNFSPTARVYGGSLFDQVIAFRNALLADNAGDIGSLHLGKIDGAIRHISRYRGEVGALDARLDSVKRRLATDQVNITDVLSRCEDVDMAQAITELRMFENVERAAMQIGARVVPQTLLDFLR